MIFSRLILIWNSKIKKKLYKKKCGKLGKFGGKSAKKSKKKKKFSSVESSELTF